MRRTRLVSCLDRIAATRSHFDVTRLARQLAEIEGCSAMEIIAEAERITAVCHQRGITSTDGMVRYVAAELGITAAELEAEMTRYREVLA